MKMLCHLKGEKNHVSTLIQTGQATFFENWFLRHSTQCFAHLQILFYFVFQLLNMSVFQLVFLLNILALYFQKTTHLALCLLPPAKAKPIVTSQSADGQKWRKLSSFVQKILDGAAFLLRNLSFSSSSSASLGTGGSLWSHFVQNKRG